MGIALGNFGDLDFSGAQALIDKINTLLTNKTAYQGCTIPASVAAYRAGSFVNGVWNQKIDFTLPEVKAYEACGADKTRTMAALIFGTDPGKPLTDDQASANLQKIVDIDAFAKDIDDFKNYTQIKLQNTNGWTTPQALTQYYGEYFGSYPNYQRASNLVAAESQRRQKALMNQSTLLQSTVKTDFQVPMLTFYSSTLQNYASRFTDDEQNQLHQFFVSETPMHWTPDEFTRIALIVKRVVSPADFGQFATAVVGTVATTTFEDPGGGMTGYLQRTQAFSDALMKVGGATAADLPTASVAQSKGISLPTAVVAGVAAYVAWKAISR